MKRIYMFLFVLSVFFSACSSKDTSLIIDTKTQQQNAKEALKEL